MNEYLERISVGCSYINIIIYNFIIIFVLTFPMQTFLRFLAILISLFWIILGIHEIQNTKYKIFNILKIFDGGK
jgi:hypothetical protein